MLPESKSGLKVCGMQPLKYQSEKRLAIFFDGLWSAGIPARLRFESRLQAARSNKLPLVLASGNLTAKINHQ